MQASGAVLDSFVDDEEMAHVSPDKPFLHHIFVAAGMLAAILPGVVCFVAGMQLVGALLAAIPFIILGFVNPFMALCYLVALLPMDQLLDLGTGAFSASKMLAVPVAVGFIAQSLQRVQRVIWVQTFTWIMVLAVWAFLSIIWSSVAWISVRGSISVLLLASLPVMIVSMATSRTKIIQLLSYLLVGGGIMAVIGLLFPQTASVSRLGRESIGDVSPNHVANAIAPGLIIGSLLVFHVRRSGLRLLLLLGILLVLLMVIRTQSRAAYLGVVVGLLGGGVAAYRLNVVKWVALALAVGVALGGIALAVEHAGLLPEDAVERIFSSQDSGRLDIWRSGFQTGMERPLLGWGMGCFIVVSQTAMHAHNNFLRLFVDIGGIGLLLWLIVLWQIGVSILKCPDRFARFLAGALFAQMLIQGMFMETFTTKIAWVMTGLLLAAPRVFGEAVAHGDERHIPLSEGGRSL